MRGTAANTTVLSKKCIRDAARLLLKSSGPRQKDVNLGIRCMRDLMLATIDGRRNYLKRQKAEGR